MSNLSNEEKIDYIYKNMKLKKRFFYIKIFFKVLIVLLIIYGYFNIIPNINKKDLSEKFSVYISDITKPIISNMLKELKSDEIILDGSKKISKSLINKLKGNSNLLKEY